MKQSQWKEHARRGILTAPDGHQYMEPPLYVPNRTSPCEGYQGVVAAEGIPRANLISELRHQMGLVALLQKEIEQLKK